MGGSFTSRGDMRTFWVAVLPPGGGLAVLPPGGDKLVGEDIWVAVLPPGGRI